jgi:hypothetical protein
MTKRKAKYYRKFLNSLDQSGTAFVAFSVDQYKSGAVSANFSIKDCSTEATLEFYVSKAVRVGKEEYKAGMAKIAVLREAIDEFEKAFTGAVDDRNKKRRKARKK